MDSTYKAGGMNRRLLLWGGLAAAAATLVLKGWMAERAVSLLGLQPPVVPTVDFVGWKDVTPSHPVSQTEVISPKEELGRIVLSSLPKDHPFYREKVLRTPQAMLWLPQWEYILDHYNSHLPKNTEALDEFVFPLIFPPLRETFPDSLDEFAKRRPHMAGKILPHRTILIITVANDGKHAHAFYKDGVLRQAGIGSPWKPSPAKNGMPAGIKTKEGMFSVVERFTFVASGDYKRAPMVYPLKLKKHWGFYVHGRNTVTGDQASKGCYWIPHVYAKALHDEIVEWTPVLIDFTKPTTTENIALVK